MLGKAYSFEHKCTVCKLVKPDYRNAPAIGELFVMEDIVADYQQISDIYDTVVTEHVALAATDPNIDTTIYNNNDKFICMYVEEVSKFGFNGMDIILPYIPINRYPLPPLHMMLGIGNDIIVKNK